MVVEVISKRFEEASMTQIEMKRQILLLKQEEMAND